MDREEGRLREGRGEGDREIGAWFLRARLGGDRDGERDMDDDRLLRSLRRGGERELDTLLVILRPRSSMLRRTGLRDRETVLERLE